MTELTPYDPNNIESQSDDKKKHSLYKMKKTKSEKASTFFFAFATVLFVFTLLCLLSPLVYSAWVIIGSLILLVLIVVSIALVFIPFLIPEFRGFLKSLSDSIGDTSLLDGILNLIIVYGQYIGIFTIVFYGIAFIILYKSGKENHRRMYISSIVMFVLAIVLEIIIIVLRYTGVYNKE